MLELHPKRRIRFKLNGYALVADFADADFVMIGSFPQPTEDGAVYVLSRFDVVHTDEAEARRRGVVNYFYGAGARDVPYLWRPRALRGRPVSQDSTGEG